MVIPQIRAGGLAGLRRLVRSARLSRRHGGTDHGAQQPVGCGGGLLRQKPGRILPSATSTFLPALRPISGAWCRGAPSASGSRRSVRASRQLLDDAEDAVLVLDGGLQVIDANAAAIVLLDDDERLRLRHRRVFAQHPDEDAKLQALLRLIVLKRENVE
jgi:PAS domain-containing protein